MRKSSSVRTQGRTPWLSLPLALVVTVLTGAASQAATPPKEDTIPPFAGDKAAGPVTLTNGTGDGSLTISVDGYGSFGTSTPAGQALYNPTGPLAAGSTTFESGLYFSALGDYLTTDSFGAQLPQIEVTLTGTTKANSTITAVPGWHITLEQRLGAASPTNGSAFTQEYRFRNDTGAPQAIRLVRFFDGDLVFDGDYNNDFGAISEDGERLYQFDSGDDLSQPVTRVAIRSTRTPGRVYTVQPFVPDPTQPDVNRFSEAIDTAGGIPSATANEIHGDGDGDGVSDTGFDPVLALQDEFTVAAGGTLVYTTITEFGTEPLGNLVYLFADGFETGDLSRWSP